MSFWTSQYEAAMLSESNARDDYIDDLTHELTDHCDANMMEYRPEQKRPIWERVDAIAPEYVSIVHDRTPCEEWEEDPF